MISRCVIFAFSLLAQPAWSQAIGAATAVNPATFSDIPGRSRRALDIGDSIVYDQKITTESDGQALITFVDRSTITVGADSEIVIDEFVYDRGAKAGRLATSLTRGALRFIGGAISKNPDSVTVKTPSSTLGIRGGVMIVGVDGEETTAILVHGKEMTVTGVDGQTKRVVRNDFGITIGRNGMSEPVRVRPEVLRQLTTRLEPTPHNPRPVDATRVTGIAGEPKSATSTAPPDLLDVYHLIKDARQLVPLPVPAPTPRTELPPPVVTSVPEVAKQDHHHPRHPEHSGPSMMRQPGKGSP